MVFIPLENGLMIGLKMEVFLSQPNILCCGRKVLRLGKDTCLHVADSSFAFVKVGFALAKVGFASVNLFIMAKGGFTVTNQKLILNFIYSFIASRLLLATTNSFVAVKVGLHRGEPKTSILQSLASHQQSSLFALAN